VNIDPQQSFPSRECPSCACEVPSNNNRCPICGYVFPTPTATQRSLRIGGALIMLGILALMLLLSLF